MQLKYDSIIFNYELGRLRMAAVVAYAATLSHSWGYDSQYDVHHSIVYVEGKLSSKTL
jgi:hypothetical protein